MFLRLLVVIGQTIQVVNYLNIFADHLHHYIISAFRNRNGVFEQDNVPCLRRQIVLDGFLNSSYSVGRITWQILIWLSTFWVSWDNSPNFKKLPFCNIPDMHNCCLNIWYNLYLVINQRNVASMPRWAANVLRSTHYYVAGHKILALPCILLKISLEFGNTVVEENGELWKTAIK